LDKAYNLIWPLIITLAALNLAFAQQYPHRDFDWEGDGDLPFDLNITLDKMPPQELESCYACHFGGMFQTKGKVLPRKKCEDCHTINASLGRSTGPYLSYEFSSVEMFFLRPDYDLSNLQVYEHLSIRNSEIGDYSTCLSYNTITGEGVCHGISIEYGRDIGFYAFNKSLEKSLLKDGPYRFTFYSDNLPDTRDCKYCHDQTKTIIKKAWGDPQQINTPQQIRWHVNATSNKDCLECHFKGLDEPENFHSAGIYVERIEFEVDEGILNSVFEFVSRLIEYLRRLISRWI
jgi:hypothetical protein